MAKFVNKARKRKGQVFVTNLLQICYNRLNHIPDQAVTTSRRTRAPKSRLRHHTSGALLTPFTEEPF
jgi:hypothetical protein